MRLAPALALAASTQAANLPRQSPAGSATVDLSSTRGPAQSLASGFLYGFPDNGTSVSTHIPPELVTPLNPPASRGGGSQLPAPDLGWAVGGRESYAARFESTLSNYRTTRAYGGDFILLVSDLWGSDGVDDSGGYYPGDDGDWEDAEAFWGQLLDDIVENDMVEGLVFDIWNEPDIEQFWNRTWDHFLELYVRSHNFVREELPELQICGPSFANSPALDDEQWSTLLATIAENDIVPDIYSWHHIDGQAPDPAAADFVSLLETHGLPKRPIDVNEYAWPEEQNNAHTAWYISQLERNEMRGLRANWAMGPELHDFLANLVFKDGEEYKPTGEWYLYEYYAAMEGERAVSTASEDGLFDAFAVVQDDGTVKIIAGTASVVEPYEISVSGLSELGLEEDGEVEVRTIRFDYEGIDVDTGGPVDLGTETLEYSGDTLSILLDPPNNSTGFAYEILGGQYT